jgi:hypothetical protein
MPAAMETPVLPDTLEAQLASFEANGYLLIPGALTRDETEKCRSALNQARSNGWEEGLNHVGNMWFDCLLDRMSETFRPLVAHRSVRPMLNALYGPQCQLRGLRGHINPGPYKQEWHLDFYGYWKQQCHAPCASKAVGINTTFYFQDNGPGIAGLTYVKGGHRIQPPNDLVKPEGWAISEQSFNAWHDSLKHVTVYPKAGDAVIFYSHIPHRGFKEIDSVERSNIVCHYQNNPFYQGIAHVSSPKHNLIFPLVE